MGSSASAPSVKHERWWLAGLLVLATLSRFWRFWALPLTYDEYSTWNRFWPDLVGSGTVPIPPFWQAVASDAHPMLHHAWYRLLGSAGLLEPHWLSIFLLKLPFLIAGVGVVWLSYVAGKRWFNPRVGLLVASAMVVMQPAVMHAQIARPYALGMVFVLALAVSLKGLVEGRSYRWLTAGLWLALAMASHYFAGLTAIGLGLVVLLGHPHTFKHLAFAAGTGLLLFAPHLPTTFQQFGHGDLATVVQAPSLGFVTEHLGYSLNYLVPGWLLLVGLIGAVFWTWRSGQRRAAGALLVWLIPLAVGTVYSLAVGPILQHRVLVFALPFLLAPCMVAVDQLIPKWTRGTSGLLVLLLGAGLIWNRAHYEVFYEREYLGAWEGYLWGRSDVFNDSLENDSIVTGTMKRPDVCGRGSTGLLSFHPFIGRHSLQHYASGQPCGLDVPLFSPDSLSTVQAFHTYLDSMQTDSECAFIGLTGHYDRPQPELLGMVLDAYPSLVADQGYHNGAWYWLMRRPEKNPAHTLQSDWHFEGNEWGEIVRLPLGDGKAQSNSRLQGWYFFKSHFQPEQFATDARLVLNWRKDGETVHSRISHAADFALPGDTAWDVFVGVYFEDLRGLQPDEAEVFWWNPNGETFQAGPLEVRTLPRNRRLYGLTQPLYR